MLSNLLYICTCMYKDCKRFKIIWSTWSMTASYELPMNHQFCVYPIINEVVVLIKLVVNFFCSFFWNKNLFWISSLKMLYFGSMTVTENQHTVKGTNRGKIFRHRKAYVGKKSVLTGRYVYQFPPTMWRTQKLWSCVNCTISAEILQILSTIQVNNFHVTMHT